MCGSVRLTSGERVRFGGDLEMKVAASEGKFSFHKGKWVGWARYESLQSEHSQEKGKLAFGHLINAESYTERDSHQGPISFKLPAGSAIQAAMVKEPLKRADTTINPGEILIVTVAATPQQLASCDHNRHPLLVRTGD